MRPVSLKDRAEFLLANAAFRFFEALPVDRASDWGERVGHVLGRVLPVSGRARANLARIMPELPLAERERIVSGMWGHLGRVAAEFTHLGGFGVGPGERIEVEGAEYLEARKAHQGPCLFVTAHLGNWELAAYTITALDPRPLSVVYRAASNALVEKLYREGRGAMGVELIPKGAAGARQALKVLKEGHNLGLLVDQKMNDGIAVPFFGIPAMTAPALASFAIKFSCPVLPVRVVRTEGARFRATFEPPLAYAQDGDMKANILDLMTRVNQTYERWIRETPEQWLWLHNRWPKA